MQKKLKENMKKLKKKMSRGKATFRLSLQTQRDEEKKDRKLKKHSLKIFVKSLNCQMQNF